jgi:hypothetical protein
MILRYILAIALAALLFPVQLKAGEPEKKTEPSKLAVLVVFDQMRGDYLTRWNQLFGDGGFHRLETEGAWYQNCHYPYAHTVTGAGHASFLTGCTPMTHGIVANDWYDRTTGQEVYCATSPHYQRVPPLLPEDSGAAVGKRSPGPWGSPDRLLAPTLGDALKDATNGKGRVVALSLKDRSCVLPGGRKADACYWFDSTLGMFVTSTFYRDRLHPWVEDFNQTRPADQWFQQTWTKLRPNFQYEKLSGPDDQAGEGSGVLQGRTFPHSMKGGLKKPGKLSRDALNNSPFGNEMLLELAKRAIIAEGLGAHETPDLLSISFSSNDAIGHCWGPDSQEVLDVTLRSDLIVKELLEFLDAKVGKGRYTLVLTADHGVCPLPEVARQQGKDAGRILPGPLARDADAFLDETFGKGDGKLHLVEHVTSPWVYLNRTLLQQRGLNQSEVEEKLAGWLVKQPGIQAAYTRTQLLRGIPVEDTLGQAVRRSFHPDRSGDVTVVVKPYWQISAFLTGTGHGTPHAYDTHVPLLVYGPGVRPGIHPDRVVPQMAAAILAHALQIKPPAMAEYTVPPGLFAKR